MRFSRIAFVFLAILPALLGCGRKTMPVPPQGTLPAPITDLAYVLEGGGVTLSWSYPTRMENGEKLSGGVDSFEIIRAVVPEEESCPGCPLPFAKPRRIQETSWSVEEGRVRFHESLDRPGSRYYYKVRSRRARAWRSSGDSNVIFFELFPAGESGNPAPSK